MLPRFSVLLALLHSSYRGYIDRNNRSGRRFVGFCLLACTISLFTGCRSFDDTGGIPAAPRGYRSMAEIEAAVALGLLKLVDVDPGIPDTIEAFTDIAYRTIDGISLRLDIYRPRQISSPVPTLVFIHGGSWRSGDRSDYLRYLVDYAEKGYVTVTVSYRLQQQAKFPAAVQDVKCALSWIAENADAYSIDPDRVAMIGGSAGAHLALLVAYGTNLSTFEHDSAGDRNASSVDIRCVVDFYGPTDLRTDFAIQHTTVEAFLGTTYAENPGVFDDASPIKHVSDNAPPTLIFHGTIDQTVPVKQADLLAAALLDNGIEYDYHRLSGWPHTMDAAKPVNVYCQYYMDEFFREYLF